MMIDDVRNEYAQIKQKRKHKQRTMVVPNNINSSMSGRKHHLFDDHRDMVDYRQVPASVASVPAPVPTHVPAPEPVRALPHTNHKQTEPTPLGKERNIPHENKFKASAVMADELMSVFFKANTGRYRPIHRPIPIPRMPEGLGIKINSNNA